MSPSMPLWVGGFLALGPDSISGPGSSPNQSVRPSGSLHCQQFCRSRPPDWRRGRSGRRSGPGVHSVPGAREGALAPDRRRPPSVMRVGFQHERATAVPKTRTRANLSLAFRVDGLWPRFETCVEVGTWDVTKSGQQCASCQSKSRHRHVWAF